MPSYTPKHYFGVIPGSYGETGLVPWPKHMKPRAVRKTPQAELALPTVLNMGEVFFVTLDRRDRVSIATTIELLISALDALDGDCDLEDGRDDEPSLCGMIEPHGEVDLEADSCDDEWSGDENEGFLGWSERCGQGASEPILQMSGFDAEEGGELGYGFDGSGYQEANALLKGKGLRQVSVAPSYYPIDTAAAFVKW